MLAATLACLLMGLAQGAEAQGVSSHHWAVDSGTSCAVFDATLKPGDSVSWNGACRNGLAEGSGTATFFNRDGIFEIFTGDFSAGRAQDGAVTIQWGKGWSYDGEMMHGRFDGEGILTNDRGDQFAGWWKNGRLNGAGRVIHADGGRYEGRWKDDRPSGHGVMVRADGTRLEGEFLNGAYTPHH